MEKKEIKQVILSNDPHIHTRSVLFDEDKEEIKKKNKKQFITCQAATLTVLYEDGTAVNLFADKGYVFDGVKLKKLKNFLCREPTVPRQFLPLLLKSAV